MLHVFVLIDIVCNVNLQDLCFRKNFSFNHHVPIGRSKLLPKLLKLIKSFILSGIRMYLILDRHARSPRLTLNNNNYACMNMQKLNLLSNGGILIHLIVVTTFN